MTAYLGVLFTAFVFGVRHGIDWDHIAAIADIAGSRSGRRRSVALASLYAGGHGLVVFAIGAIAVTSGSFVHPGLDRVMERVVGLTLVVMGAYVLDSLLRRRADFVMQSRWMLLFALCKRLTHSHEHEHALEPSPQTTLGRYAPGTAVLVGMLHGIGAETPTQVLLFISAAGIAGRAAGLAMVASFVLGVLVSNAAIALASAAGFDQKRRGTRPYLAFAGVTATFSLLTGTFFLSGAHLPSLLGG